MRLKLENIDLLNNLMKILSELVIEVEIKVSKEGLNIICIDPCNVVLVSLNLQKNNFLEMEVDEETLGIDLMKFKSILNRLDGQVELIKEDNKLIIKNENKKFSMSLINVEGEKKEEPNLNFTGKIEMNSQDLKEYIEDCSIVADSTSFISNGELFIINASGDLDSFNSEFTDEVKIEGTGNSKFSLEYLNKIVNTLTDKVVLNLGNDYPLKLDFVNDKISLSFVLAPRVDMEE